MYDTEITEVAKLCAAMVDADVHLVTEINIAPGVISVTTKSTDGMGIHVTTQIPWKFERNPLNNG